MFSRRVFTNNGVPRVFNGMDDKTVSADGDGFGLLEFVRAGGKRVGLL